MSKNTESKAESKAAQMAKKINKVIGMDACRWCKYSRAFFVILPFGSETLAAKVSALFVQAGALEVITGEDAAGEGIQVSAYV